MIVIDGGLVMDVQGIRVWATTENGLEILILVRYYR